jgi:Xaa-Pro dipeptidase
MDFNAYQQILSTQLRGSECPFPEAEFQQRLSRVLALLDAEKLDALLLTDPADIYYLTGYSTFEVSVHIALVVMPTTLTLQVPSIEMGPAMACTRVDRVIGYRWEGVDQVLEPLAAALGDVGARVGVDFWHGSLRHGVMKGLGERLPRCVFVDAAPLLDRVRIVKTPTELTCLTESARITTLGIAAAEAAVRPGLTDSAIAAVGAEAMLAAGSEFMSMQPIVTAGQRSSVIHTNHKRHPIQEGQPVFLEFGASFQRYTAPMMRTIIAGKPSRRMVEVFDGCRRIYDTLLKAMRPGQTFDTAAMAAEEAMAPLAGEVFFSGVFGYTVGAQFPPSWVEGSGFIARGGFQVFQPDMVFHLPICLRIPGEWGIGCSDTVRVTEQGAVPVTANPWTLEGTG